MKTLIFSAFLLICLFSNAQVQVAWFNYPGGVAVATDASDNVYTANWDYNAGGDITLTKRNSAGTILWEVPYNNTDATRHEVATWVDTDGAGNILVSGTIRSGYSNPVNANSLLMKFDPSGNLLWRVVYETSFDGSSTVKCITDAQNNIYVVGIGNSGTGLVTQVKKFSPAGTPIWNYFDNAGIGAPVNFKLTPDNNILITSRGITGSINGFAKITLNGVKIWSYTGINSLTVGDAAGDSSGNTYLINGEYVVSNAGSILKKLSPSGAVIWSKTNTMKGIRVEVGTDNNPVISGYPAVGYGAAFMKYDINGNILWQNLDADGPSLALLAHGQMKMDGLNAAYLVGSTMSQMGVCKVNSNGTSAWTATTSSGYPVCMDFGTDNSIFVVGGTTARLTQSGTVPPVIIAPSNLTATASGSSTINLSWMDNATNETNYVLQRSLSQGSGFSTIATLAANIKIYSNTGLSSSTTYYYKVQAINAASSSAWSNVANATTATPPLTAPSPPSNLTAVATGCNAILLNWIDNSTNETSFEIRRATSVSGTYSTIVSVTSNTTTYTNTALTKGKKYYYMVRAVNSAGSSAFTSKSNATASCPKVLKSGEIIEDTELQPEESLQTIKLYPNPSSDGLFYLSLPAETTLPVTLRMFTASGQKVIQKELYDLNNTIQTENLKTGIYFITVYTNGNLQKLKLQIKK
jgi:fibronectin type 3 domain-containing protein